MPRMIVIWPKPLRYPGGSNGKEYKQGEEFEIEPGYAARDIEHFTKIRAAKLVEDKKKVKPAATVEPVAPVTTAQAEPAEPDDVRKYRTRAMRAKE